jgi:hypothetical protein
VFSAKEIDMNSLPIKLELKWLIGMALFAVLLFSVALFIGTLLGIDGVPAVAVLYKAFDASWLGPTRVCMNIIVGTCIFVLSLLTFSTIDSPRVRTRTEVKLIGVALFCTSMLNVSVMCLVIFGGAWHFAGLVFGIIDAIALVLATGVMFMNIINHKV